ncbi:MAG: 16S rRNA (guanine(966)-N(2))-methyltransferase RsmD [Proteobacteria bacterium]|nr:16S rRNA (guanine(966)-N(2))-methyltransferase RsmD [Pseudomonadota bacterium]TDJ33431.1 MAG: 16S rRNA (guanine(966)-N(2))-methyltransferase RsmD [Gammaproteobacteria bacterium]
MGRQISRGCNDTGSPSGRLRIVAGKWRSRLLPVVDQPGLRPTPDRIRETLFNWLASTIEGASCLDLFAGTGALGFEALSRGAGEVVFVEKSARAAALLKESANMLDASDARIHKADAISYLHGDHQPFNIVFLDPPFTADLLGDLCRLLDEGGWLAEGARIYLEQSCERPWPRLPDGWSIINDKTAGRVRYALVTVKD